MANLMTNLELLSKPTAEQTSINCSGVNTGAITSFEVDDSNTGNTLFKTNLNISNNYLQRKYMERKLKGKSIRLDSRKPKRVNRVGKKLKIIIL